jgi:hypothetical protein
VLAGLWTLFPRFPDNVVIMQAATLIMAAAACAAMYLFLVRHGRSSRSVALASCLLAGVVPMFLFLSTITMSEGLFGLLVVWTLWRVQHAIDHEEPSLRRQMVTGMIVAAPVLCRGIGIAMVIASIVALVRARRAVLVTLSTALAVMGAWAVWVWSAGPASDVTRYYTDYGESFAALIGPHGLRILFGNLLLIVTSPAGLVLDGLRPVAGGAAIAVLVAAGLVAWTRIIRNAARGQLLGMSLIAYAALTLVWPWPPPRFLIPLLPFLVAASLDAATHAISGLPRGVNLAVRATGVGILGLALGMHLVVLGQLSRVIRRTGYPHDLGVLTATSPNEPARWRDYQALFAWIRANSEPGDVLASGFDTMAYLYTDRQAFRPVPYHPESLYGVSQVPAVVADGLRARLRDGAARYLLLLPGDPDASVVAAAVDAIRTSHPGALQRVYQGEDSRFVVFRVGGE